MLHIGDASGRKATLNRLVNGHPCSVVKMAWSFNFDKVEQASSTVWI